MFSRLVTGLMDKLEQKLGREGLRTRVRTVSSQVAKVRGKENLRTSWEGAGSSRPPSSPLLTATADNLPVLSPARKKGGAPVSARDHFIPEGEISKKIAR